jgi:hypothetical protein
LPAERVAGVPAGAVEVGVRAEHVAPRDVGAALASGTDVDLGRGVVKLVEPLGGVSHVHVELAPGAVVISETRATPPGLGAEVALSCPASALRFFAEGGATIASGAP